MEEQLAAAAPPSSSHHHHLAHQHPQHHLLLRDDDEHKDNPLRAKSPDAKDDVDGGEGGDEEEAQAGEGDEGDEGMDLLHVAVARNNPHLLRELLAAGTRDPNAPCPRSGLSPLHLAAWGGHVGMVVNLLVHGADVEQTAKRTGWTPLHVAARRGHEEVAAALIDAGADLHRLDRCGFSVLAYAVLGGNLELVRFLLANGVDPNGHQPVPPDEGSSHQSSFSLPWEVAPLLLASQEGKIEVVRLLLNHNANPNVRDAQGRSPLSLAVRGLHRNVVEVLLAHGADVGSEDNEGTTALHSAVRLAVKGPERDMEIAWSLVELLLRAGADVEAKDHQQVTPLMSARGVAEEERLLALARQNRRRTATSVVCLSVIGLATSFVMLSRLRG